MHISIHAPARGATVKMGKEIKVTCISIHAPARGATSGGLSPQMSFCNFNPRAREGRDFLQRHTGCMI